MLKMSVIRLTYKTDLKDDCINANAFVTQDLREQRSLVVFPLDNNFFFSTCEWNT